MAATQHPDYHEELDKLQYTLGYIDKTILSQASKKGIINKSVRSAMKHFDSADSEAYNALMINTMLQDRMELRLRNLTSSRNKPYFARVDFLENHMSQVEKLYLGKTSLIREEDQELIIIDWRAPAANLYYEERLGSAQYLCPEGVIKGELSLKRQFSIDQGKLLEIMDIDITTNDEFLQSYLGASADNRLKDIVSTIQAEQNSVIRSDMWNPLIVQGAAGSGKTTIALHRIAYLIYVYEKTIKPESFMIIAPNKLFLNYISEVLPELGVEQVKQTTFIDLSLDCIGNKLKIHDPNEKLAQLTDTSGVTTINSDLVKNSSAFKSSMDFKRILEEYVHMLEDHYLPDQDFKLGSVVLYTREEINSQFKNEYYDLPFNKRIDKIKKQLQNKVKSDKDQICGKFQSISDQKVQALKDMTLEDDIPRAQIISIIDNKDRRINEIARASKCIVNEYLKRIEKKTPLQYYMEFFTEGAFEKLSKSSIDPALCQYIKDSTIQLIKSKILEIEDLAPILYLKLQLEGLDQKIPIEHIVVDEAQDLSVFQIYLLRRLIRGSSMTMLGDLCQGIHSYRGTTDWETILNEVFDNKCKYLTLKQSYRTTVEIMDAANSVISKLAYDLPLAEPVIRHGQLPQVKLISSINESAASIAENIKDCLNNNYKTIAILCKTDYECVELKKHMKQYYPDIKLITGKEKEYPGGMVLLPAYLAKGLEFDAVIIANASSEAYPEDPLHTKLLYVAMTRPLHRLYIYYQGDLTPLLADLPK